MHQSPDTAKPTNPAFEPIVLTPNDVGDVRVIAERLVIMAQPAVSHL